MFIYPQGTILDDHAHEIRIRLASPVHCQWTFKLLSNAPLWLGLIRSCVDVVVLVLIYIQPTVYTNTLQCNLYTGWHACPMVDTVSHSILFDNNIKITMRTRPELHITGPAITNHTDSPFQVVPTYVGTLDLGL